MRRKDRHGSPMKNEIVMKTGIGGKMSDKKSVLEEVMKDMEDGKEIKIPSTSIKDFVERKYGI
jgi:hypothetical protein